MKTDWSASIAKALSSPPRTLAEIGPRVAALQFELPGDPWSRWLLLALHRHEARQTWVGEVVRERLGGNLWEIGRAGAFGHPDGADEGDVPEMPGWRYCFHGSGCCLTRKGGEVLDVDFVDGGTEWIDPYFYQGYLASVAHGPRVERGLVCSAPFRDAWMTDLAMLRAVGWIEGPHKVRLTPLGREVASVLQPRDSAADGSSSMAAVWHACVVGRFDVAAELLESSPLPAELSQARATLIEARAAMLVERTRGVEARFGLEALAALGREHAEATVASQLQREPLDGVVSAALDVLALWGIADHREAITATMMRARGDQVPAPHIRTRCAELLMAEATPGTLTQPARERLLAALQQPGRASDGERGLLLWLLDDSVGLAHLRAALRSEVPIARAEAAGALGIIGTPEAISILREVEGPEAQSILALLRGQDPVNGPEPIGELIDFEGQERRVYRLEEIAAAHVGDLTAESFDHMATRYGALVRRWRAS